MKKNKAVYPEKAAYTKAYREAHPEKVLQWKITGALKILKANGYTVIAPEGDGGVEERHI